MEKVKEEIKHVSEISPEYSKKLKKAVKTLFYQRHRMPGVKGWELRRSLGKDYLTVLELLNVQLEDLGLTVKIVFEGSENPDNPSAEAFESARYYVTITEPMSATELKMSGWRVDNVAALTVTVAYLISKQGKAPKKDVEKLLKQKFPQWKLDYNLVRFIRQGYLVDDDEGILYMGWRARAEIDKKSLLDLILTKEV